MPVAAEIGTEPLMGEGQSRAGNSLIYLKLIVFFRIFVEVAWEPASSPVPVLRNFGDHEFGTNVGSLKKCYR